MNILSEHTMAFFGSAFMQASRDDLPVEAAEDRTLRNAARCMSILPLRCCIVVWRRLRIWSEYCYTMRELDSMKDHDLRDVGLKRASILDCAWSEAWRRHCDGTR